MVARNKIVISGTIGSPAVEVWSCSFHTAGSVTTDPTELQAWANDAAAILGLGETAYGEITAIMGGLVSANKIQIYGYEASGPAVAVGEASFTWDGDGASVCPFPTSVCVSLYTAVASRRTRGRFFWPGLAMAVQAGGTFQVEGTLVPEFAQMLDDVCDAGPGGGNNDLAVYSPTGNTVTNVTQVRVGDRPDTQRGRHDNVDETYTTVPFPP